MVLTAGCSGGHPASLVSVTSETPITESVIEPEPEIPEPKLPVLIPASFPEGRWQINTLFPDWNGYVDDTLAMNHMISFKAYEGQGKLYVTLDEAVTGFELYVNETKIDTSLCLGGTCYSLDISELVHNGKNTVSILDVRPRDEEAKVRLSIGYPEVITGTLSEEGISEESLSLISDLIESDVENGFPSASLAVLRHGRLVYENAWGSLNAYEQDGSKVASPIPATKDTLYDLASVTKMFSVNYAIQKLVSDGAMSVDDRIADYLGSGFYNDTVNTKYSGRASVSLDTQIQWKSGLTVRDLLCHQGGFPADPKYHRNNVTGDKAVTLKQINETALMYKPGTETLYSDVDYMVLGLVVEKITEKDLNTYLKETFWDPMGLTRITYNPLDHGFTVNDCAATELNGNTRDGSVYFNGVRTYTLQGEVHDEKAWYCMGGVSGHAGLFASAGDLAKLASCMLTGGYGNNRYFSRDTIDSFTSPKSADFPTWGLGWWREADAERVWYFGTQSSSDTVGHQGWTGTLVMIDPSRDLVVVYLTNKINTPLTDKEKNVNRFRGSAYTSATLGFVPQILSIGMDSEEDVSALLLDLTADLADSAVKLITSDTRVGDPVVLSAKAKIDLLNKRMKKDGSSKYKELAAKLTDEIRDLLPEGLLPDSASGNSGDVTLGDERFDEYLPLIKDKKVAIFTNQTGIVGDDEEKNLRIEVALIDKGVNVSCLFAPEHGIKGSLGAGEGVKADIDARYNIPIYPATANDMKGVRNSLDEFDVLLVDIQDVGLRFYTYYVSMYYLMQECALNDKPVIILDRPNPNGFYVDGPILDTEFRSNVGLLPITTVHGMTLGELAKMIVGEGWLDTGNKDCDLTVIPCVGYEREDRYRLSVNPSPNLKNMKAIYLYASICYFENTAVSCGRGTDDPFVIFGSPYLPDSSDYSFVFVPEDKPGASDPVFEGKECFGRNLSGFSEDAICKAGINLEYLIKAYEDIKALHPEVSFFGQKYANGRYWIDLLFGTDKVRKMIEEGKDAAAIKASWQDDIERFRVLRKPYLIY
ncbi:MAG: penicillin binding protein PBP4B [Lachnospiraceae bacterium]|nr:penicillin binding protein PBP4B [Lachnospiraceae bacterium]